MFEEWAGALRELTATKEAAESWRHNRYEFAHRLGHALTDDRQTGEPVVSGHVVYGVWLKWGLLYVGQTRGAERRLRDLPVGESHHLANTFPPEIWHRVVVVSWPKLAEAASAVAEVEPDEVGLGLEHRLQAWLQPLANASRRTPGGNWRSVDWTRSRSRGAVVGARIDRLFTEVRNVWEEASQAEVAAESDVYRVVFPADFR
ncbi:hypothetical protein AB0I60_32175 [Actinosynnema sp. NPDC050436]|uniref:hypothetical protein n=1 Tax=Actinosynnema sp. NPDC050436 TaxID=3155659 RepID=UPI0033C5EE01